MQSSPQCPVNPSENLQILLGSLNILTDQNNQAKQTVKQICVGVYLLIKKNGLANFIKYKEMRITKVFEPWLFENHTIAIFI